MTAPALPPEVERAIDAAANAAHDAGNAYGSDYWSSSEREFARITSENATAALRTAIRAALDKRGEVSAASAASARALGGDGEPVAKRTGWDVIGPTGIVLGSPSRAECESVAARLNAIESGSSCPVRYTVAPHYESRPAAPASVERRMAFLNVEAAVEAAVKAEREACAQVLNQMGDDDMASDREIAKWERAIEAIRARGAKT